MKKTSGDTDACRPARQAAHSLCLDEWMTAWDEQREAGTFLGMNYLA